MTNIKNVDSDLRRLNLINVDQWNKAKWSGVGYFYGGGQPPGIVLAFPNQAAARKLFQDLHARVGREDTQGLLRVSFIEGDLPGRDDENPGYTVMVTTDQDRMLADVKAKGEELKNPIVGFLLRKFRCVVSPRLAQFKAEFAQHEMCFLTPGGMDGQPLLEEGLLIHNVAFRNVAEISGMNDPDYPVFSQPTTQAPSQAN